MRNSHFPLRLDLSCWADAHVFLSTLVQEETLLHFASYALPSWQALGRLARIAAEIGCEEEICGALTRVDELQGALQRHKGTAIKVQRLLSWQPSTSVSTAVPQQSSCGCRLTRQQADASLDQAVQAQRISMVRLRFGKRVTEHPLTWEA